MLQFEGFYFRTEMTALFLDHEDYFKIDDLSVGTILQFNPNGKMRIGICELHYLDVDDCHFLKDKDLEEIISREELIKQISYEIQSYVGKSYEFITRVTIHSISGFYTIKENSRITIRINQSDRKITWTGIIKKKFLELHSVVSPKADWREMDEIYEFFSVPNVDLKEV